MAAVAGAVSETRESGETTVALDPDALAALEEQRSFLRRSMSDLRREHEAGDLDEADYLALSDDYTARLASVDRAVSEGRAVFSAAHTPRSRRRTAAVVSGVVVFAVVCGLIVAQLAGRRTAGATITGNPSASTRAQLATCLSGLMGANSQSAPVIGCYEKVLQRDPGNVEARTYRAGLGVMINQDLNGLNDLIAVATSNPSYPDVHAFLAVAFYRLGRADSALAELKKLDSLNPTPLMRDLVSGLRAQLDPSASSATTSTPPASTATTAAPPAAATTAAPPAAAAP